MATESRIRLYESALLDVRYVYGAPVKYSRDPKLLKERAAAKERAIEREEAARARVQQVSA